MYLKKIFNVFHRFINFRKTESPDTIDVTKQSKAATAATKNKGRPGSRKEENLDGEKFILIEIWSGYENLYNTKHNDYQNRDKLQKCLQAIEKALNENGITADVRQISKNLDLKNYYGGQKRLVEHVESGNGADVVFVSGWKFYKHLEFLKDEF